MFDEKRIAEKIKLKLGTSKAESEPSNAEEDASEGDMSPGQMLLDAIKENDPKAVEEAIHRCKSY
jgi:hypothetical protein